MPFGNNNFRRLIEFAFQQTFGDGGTEIASTNDSDAFIHLFVLLVKDKSWRSQTNKKYLKRPKAQIPNSKIDS